MPSLMAIVIQPRSRNSRSVVTMTPLRGLRSKVDGTKCYRSFAETAFERASAAAVSRPAAEHPTAAERHSEAKKAFRSSISFWVSVIPDITGSRVPRFDTNSPPLVRRSLAKPLVSWLPALWHDAQRAS